MLTDREQRKAAKEFAKTWQGIGYEKGDSHRFWIALLQEVFGVKNATEYIRFEDRVMLDNTSFIDGYIPSTHVLIEQKSLGKNLLAAIRQSDGSLLTPIQQAKRYSAELPYSERPRWIVTCNFEEFHIYNMENPRGEPEKILLRDLETEYYRLNFLVDREDESIKKETEVSIKAGELVGILYDALLEQYNDPDDPETLRHLNVLCVRLVFCLYAEDAGLLGRRNMFHDYMSMFRQGNFRNELKRLFRTFNQTEQERDEYLEEDLAAFPYINGGLFADDNIQIPRLNAKIINIILNDMSDNFNWSEISPTIFGSVFESTLNPESRREGGMHYTSIENIHKVIDPLFMNDLYEELEEIKEKRQTNVRNTALAEFQEKLGSLTFLDPAAGSGNFLTETYLTLRRLENQVIILQRESRGDQQIEMLAASNPIRVSINQFYGIEINDFAVTVARTALWIAESQMLKATETIVQHNLDFFPLTSSPNIVEGNALQMDWQEVIPKAKLNFIMGNPPFVGARLMNSEQKQDMKNIFGKLKGAGNLDYVSCWYKKAVDYIQDTAIKCAFVSTNSITQGEQVAILWQPLFEQNNIQFIFAYRTFKWISEAADRAAVHCVIIGFAQVENSEKYLFSSDDFMKKAENINGYLVDAPDVFINNRRQPLAQVQPMVFGSMPNDGGYLILSTEEKNELINNYPESERYIKLFIGAREYINNKERWCFWLTTHDLRAVQRIRPIMERIAKVREIRQASKRSNTQELANIPYAFGEIRQPETDYLLVPRVSSENRKYIPIGYVTPQVIASDAVLIVPEASLAHFAIMTSNVHMAWVNTVAGRLKSDYRYSASIVYNNFPWPDLTDELTIELEQTGQAILDARAIYPEWSLANLYNDLITPPELRKAHQANDKAVMEAYGFDWRTMTASECVAELMKMYQELTAEKE